MALGLPDDLWKGGAIRPLRSARKVADMVRLNIPLDPGKTGLEAFSLESSLRRMIVGQDEAIQQIVNIYQMNLTGMSNWSCKRRGRRTLLWKSVGREGS